MPLRRLRCQALICRLFALPRLGAHGWQEVHEEPPSATDQVAPKGEAEEVEAGVLVAALAVRVLAVHDLRLVGVQLETQGPEPFGDGGPQLSGLFLGVAVSNNVVCVALERTTRMVPGHPPVERVVHEQVGEQGEIGEPCGVPFSRATRAPSGICMGAVSHRPM